MTLALLLAAGLTAASVAWCLATRPDSLEARMARFSGNGVIAVGPSGARPAKSQPTTRLPKAWEAFLARAGAEWTAWQAMMVIAVYGLIGLVVGLWLAMPVAGAAGGVLVLYVRLRARQARRTQKMAEQLPDA